MEVKKRIKKEFDCVEMARNIKKVNSLRWAGHPEDFDADMKRAKEIIIARNLPGKWVKPSDFL